jgi:predicted RNase H-like HicB family nuclease
MQVTAVLTPAPEGGYTALNPDTGTASQGESVEEALANLREAVELYLEEFPKTAFATPIVTTITVAPHA